MWLPASVAPKSISIGAHGRHTRWKLIELAKVERNVLIVRSPAEAKQMLLSRRAASLNAINVTPAAVG
jgi:hypothetical protein